ncbi:MAG: hypothetical protein LC099_09240 [Anaerolineales bacterium]|nr:hypothetical protein [Anaerolineales bacterium]
MSEPADIAIHFAGGVVRFVADERRILEALNAHLIHCQGADGQLVATYRIAAVDDSTFSADVNGGVLFSRIQFDALLPLLMRDALAQLNGAAASHLIFHSAALAHRGRGIMLCGQSGSGKSSLTAWLTACGFQYLTDEVVSVPLRGEEIRGFCRSIILKRGSEFIWRRWLADERSRGFLRFADNSAWIVPTALNPNAVCHSAAPSLTLFPKYIPEAPLSVQRLTQAEALFRLLQCLVNARNFSDGGMSVAARLVKQTQAYSLIYSNVESAAEWIQQNA